MNKAKKRILEQAINEVVGSFEGRLSQLTMSKNGASSYALIVFSDLRYDVFRISNHRAYKQFFSHPTLHFHEQDTRSFQYQLQDYLSKSNRVKFNYQEYFVLQAIIYSSKHSTFYFVDDVYQQFSEEAMGLIFYQQSGHLKKKMRTTLVSEEINQVFRKLYADGFINTIEKSNHTIQVYVTSLGMEMLQEADQSQLSKPKEDMLPFLTYAKAQNIQQNVFVSLIGVEKNLVTPHHKIEKMIKQLELPYTFIRPSFFMQNLNTTHREDIQCNHDLFIPAGRAKTSFIDTRDIGAAAAVCLTDARYLNRELDITGPAALTYDEIAKEMSTILETKITYSRPSLLKFRQVMIKRRIPKGYVNVMVMLYLITQLGNAKQVTNVLEKILNRPPRTIAEYISDYKASFLEI